MVIQSFNDVMIPKEIQVQTGTKPFIPTVGVYAPTALENTNHVAEKQLFWKLMSMADGEIQVQKTCNHLIWNGLS
jgi:hypothetical protein